MFIFSKIRITINILTNYFINLTERPAYNTDNAMKSILPVSDPQNEVLACDVIWRTDPPAPQYEF